MTTINKYPSKLKYKEEEFKLSSDCEQQVKIKNGSREIKVRVMMGSSVEEMLYTIRTFENKAKDISLPDNRRLEKFVTCLGNEARDKWAVMLEDYESRNNGQGFQADQWDLAKEEWIKHYVQDPHAKDVVINDWKAQRISSSQWR